MKEQIVYKTFKTKIYPSNNQIEYFNKCFNVSRYVYNWCLNLKETSFQNETPMKWSEINTEFMKHRPGFVLEVNSRVYRQAIANLKFAYKSWFEKKTEKPKFKKKKNTIKSFSYDGRYIIEDDFKFYICGANAKKGGDHKSKSYLKNGYVIKTSENISHLKDKVKTQITISFDGINYYASFMYKEKINHIYNNHKYNIVGIDLGFKTFAVQSDNKFINMRKNKIIKLENKIKKLQSIMDRKKYNSNNYKKVKAKLNKCYNKIHYIKFDFLHKYSTWLCKNYKIIKIEDLNLEEMKKNKVIAKCINRSGINYFLGMLDYKSKIYNNDIIIIDRWYASSKICHNCGTKNKNLKLSDRIYICNNCGYVINRDLNAALNIRDFKSNN